MVCERGPGIPFGITEYSCANCSIDHPQGQRKSYVFKDDPIVVERTNDSPFQPGDAITAVDGKGIVMPEGANGFAYPKPGPVVIQIKRKVTGQDRLLYVVLNIGEDCTLQSATPASATLPVIMSGDSSVDSAKAVAARNNRGNLSKCKRYALQVVNNSGADVLFFARVLTSRGWSPIERQIQYDSVQYRLGRAVTGLTQLDLPDLKLNESLTLRWDWADAGAKGDAKKITWRDICAGG